MYGYENLHVFLLKNIYHQLGSDTFHLITENRVCSWIIPDHVMEKMCEVSCEIVYSFVAHLFYNIVSHNSCLLTIS